MNEQGILHIPDSKFCFPLDKQRLVLRLRVDRRDRPERVEVVYESKYVIQQKQQCREMERKYEDRLYAYYEAVLPLEDVRIAYVFRIWENEKGYYFSEDGLNEKYDFSLAYFNFFQLAYINEADIHREAAWMRDAVFYEIFVERFLCGIEGKDKSYINLEWGEKPKPKSFAGGDIPGITKKLDYIQGLGINALYLTPIFCAVSNHKYDISDYHMIDARFGLNEDFGELVKEAHKRGIRVVLDAVFNHCSELLPQFQDVLKRGKESPYFDWFIIHGDKPDKEKLNYEVFAFCDYMPKFNTSNREVQEFLLDIAVSWIRNYDIDGWRLDVSDEVSHDFWRIFRKKVKEAKADCVIIGENWHDANSFLRGDQYDSIMNYAFTKACLDYYNYPKWFRNTLFISVMSCLIGSFLVILTAYTMSRFQFKGRKAIMKTTLVLGMFPSFMGMIAVYIIMTQFGLINKMWGLILIYSANAPMGYLTQKGFFDTIPASIDEAARIDGATNFQVFLKINLPLSLPIIVYTALTSFTFPWSDFILPKLLLKEKDLYTVAVGLMNLGDTEFARFAAGSVFIAVPIVILYFCLMKFFVNGMTAGAVKG